MPISHFKDPSCSCSQAIARANTYAYESEPMVKPTGFREYDARWLFGKEINLMGVQALGMGLGTLLGELGKPREIVTGHDFRGYSASIKLALVTGLMAAGCKVHDIGWPSRRCAISPSLNWMCRLAPWSPPRTTRTAGPASRWAATGR